MIAVESGRQRLILQQAEEAAAELRLLPLEPTPGERVLRKLSELTRLVKALEKTSSTLTQVDQRAIWQQRAKWFRDELTSLIAERLTCAEAGECWAKIVELLFWVLEGQTGRRDQEEYNTTLGSGTTSEFKHVDDRRCERVGLCPGLTEEVLDLKTKLVLAKQESQRERAEKHELMKRLQFAVAERELLLEHYSSADNLSVEGDCMTTAQTSPCTPPETPRTPRNARYYELTEHVWMQNLHNNAQVIERLIQLNTEVVEVLNCQAAVLEREKRQHGDTGAVPCHSCAGGCGGGPDKAGCAEVAVTVDLCSTALDERRDIEGGPLVDDGMMGKPQEGMASFVDEVMHFMQDDSLPVSAGARVVELPRRGHPPAHDAGLFGKLLNVAMYIAGDDNAVKQRASELSRRLVV